MKELTLKQIAEWCGGRLPPEYAALTITGVQSDSRHVRAGDLFVALKGGRTDGHVYVKKALADGAVAALVDRPMPGLPVIEVEDTVRAYGAVARGYRNLLGIKVVRPKITETTALGAAYLAGLAVGFWKDIDELKKQWQVERTFEPAADTEEIENAKKGWADAISRTLTK